MNDIIEAEANIIQNWSGEHRRNSPSATKITDNYAASSNFLWFGQIVDFFRLKVNRNGQNCANHSVNEFHFQNKSA